jgi:tRNA-specific 2-thiouridylase
MATRVAVAMSGGVDSSVACLLLKQEGFDVVGLTMKLLPDPPAGDLVPRAPCCSLEMADDARRVCASLGIPHYTVNLVSYFEEDVIVPFTGDYAKGRTPNPCLQCNKVMKFHHLLRKAGEIGAPYVATGHYARVQPEPGGRTLLLRGVDRTKDQSYALYGLTQDELAHAMFPLGRLTKKEVREIARDAGLRTAEKPESQEICFVSHGYRQFLAERGVTPEPGPIVDVSGKVLGKHSGIPFYTVGQRRGLGVSGGEALYVVDLDLDTNTVVVGKRDDAHSSGCFVDGLNLVASETLDGPVTGTCMVRYRGTEVPATLRKGDSPLEARFDFGGPQFAVTPGQAAVLYQGDVLYGGGTIVKRVQLFA